ncbi:MAG: endopeptidase, partial [Oscillospiraceae bacterium]|nr:endopeptidase [Oscillospiraceae bacterium]
MSYPILYKSTEKDFSHNGIGMLTDCMKCLVTEERNGAYEMELQYPMSGRHFAHIGQRSIIK